MKFTSIIAALVLVIFPGSLLQASEKTTIYIDVVGNAEFDVFYHRSTSNATGAVIGGLVGAGIQAGVESSQDAKKSDAIEPMIDKSSWKTYFLDTFNSKLESKNYEAKWVDKKTKSDNGLLLKIYPDTYGFKIVDTSTMLMSAFVEFDATLSGLKIKKSKKKNFYVTSRNRRSYNDLLSNRDTTNSDLQSALNKAAKRLANKIIYNKEV